MKKLLFILLIFTIPFTISSAYKPYSINYHRDFIKLSKKEFYDYAAIPESRGIYNIANNYLMVGKYQASTVALKTFGYSDEKVKTIKKSIYIKKNSKGRNLYYFDTIHFPQHEQERFIEWYMTYMEKILLKKYIENYVGKTIDGVYITKAGILGTSMIGYNYVKKFLKSNGDKNFSDVYGTTVRERMKYFENIKIE